MRIRARAGIRARVRVRVRVRVGLGLGRGLGLGLGLGLDGVACAGRVDHIVDDDTVCALDVAHQVCRADLARPLALLGSGLQSGLGL